MMSSKKECKWFHELNSSEPPWGDTEVQEFIEYSIIQSVSDFPFYSQSDSFQQTCTVIDDTSNKDQTPKNT